MDTYCINRGTLLDNQDLSTLQYPNEHVRIFSRQEERVKRVSITYATMKMDVSTIILHTLFFQQTVHCLVDVDQCREGGFEVLRDPTGNDDTYCRAYRMDDVGNSLFVEHARSVGSCSTCSQDG